MNEKTDRSSADLNAGPSRAGNQKKGAAAQRRVGPRRTTVVPEISAFFANPDVSPSAFLKALRTEKTERFTSEDKERALAAIGGDASGARLWALMSQSRLPRVVNRWIWPVAQDRLKSVLGADFDPDGASPSDILENLCRILESRLGSKERIEAKSAENWLRIGLCWLIETKSADPWEMAEAVSSGIGADAKAASLLFRRAVSRGSRKELRLSAAAVAMGSRIVARWKSDLARARRESDGLSIRLDAAESTKRRLSEELAAARGELAQRENALKSAKQQLEDERHHWGHDLTETKAGHRRFLERIRPQLTDAIDELEMEPADPEAALKHLKSVLKNIQRDGS